MGVSGRLLKTRWAANCTGCAVAIGKGERAWWDAEARSLWCLPCHESLPPGVGGAVSLPLDAGEAGRSAQARFDRLHAQRVQRIDKSWGRLAGVVKFLSFDPQSTTNWLKGAAGERRVAEHLVRVIGDRATFLYDRRVPGSTANIDLLVIASSGVWVVDSKNWSGRVEHRDVGRWLTPDERLYVGGRDRSRTVDGLGHQIAAVSAALGGGNIPIHSALCFVEADRGWFGKPFKFRGTWVTWVQRLAEMILVPGPCDRVAIETAAAMLASRLRAN